VQGGKRLGAHATNSNRWIFPLNEKLLMRGGFVEDSQAYSRSVNLNADTLTGQQFFYLCIFFTHRQILRRSRSIDES